MTALSGSIQLRGKTAAQWAADTTPPLVRQPCVETDTGQMKIGDGVNLFADLDYVGTAAGLEWGSITGNINDQTDLQDQFDTKADRESELLTGGVLSVGSYGGSGSNNDIRATASTYFILGQGGYIGAQTDFLDIALSSAGTQRYIGIYGKTDSTLTKVEGAEAALATFPSTPANHCLFGYMLVSDASVSTTVDISGLLPKADKATQATVTTGTNDTTYLTPLSAAVLATKAALAARSQVYFQWDTISPADSTTYFLSTSPLALAVGNSNSQGVAPFTGTIYAVAISGRNNAAASSENVTFQVSVAGGAAANLSTNFVFVSNVTQLTTGLNIPVVAGNSLVVTMVTPAWVTNPTNTAGSVVLFIR